MEDLQTIEMPVSHFSKKQKIQEIVDEIVWYCGDNPLYWSDYVYQELRLNQIFPGEIIIIYLKKAKRRVDKEKEKRLLQARFSNEIKDSWGFTDYLKHIPNKKRKPNQVIGGFAMSESAIKIQEPIFRSVLASIGFGKLMQNEKWDLVKLNKKVADFDTFITLVQTATKVPEGDDRDLLQNIADALREKIPVEIVADPNAEPYVFVEQEQEEFKDIEIFPKEEKISQSRGSSLVANAIALMKKKKRPMRLKEICDELQMTGMWTSPKGKTPWATLGSVFYNEIKHKGIYSRFQKGEDKGTFVYNDFSNTEVTEENKKEDTENFDSIPSKE